MSEVNTETRADTVEQNYEDAVAQYGADNHMKIIESVLLDISVSLGMLVDGSSDQ